MYRPAAASLFLAAAALLAGCPEVPVQTVERNQTIGTAGKEQSKDALRTRSLEFVAKGPLDLAKGGKIISEAGGVAIGSTGASFKVLEDAPRFRVAASSSGFAPVTKGTFQLYTFQGDAVWDPLEISGDAAFKVAVPEGRPLTAVATFQIGETVYRVATPIVDGKPDAPLVLDPIQAMIEARVRELSTRYSNPKNDAERAERILPNMAGVTFESLERIHTICDQANVSVEKEALVSAEPEEVIKKLTPVWAREIAAKVTKSSEKAEIESFVGGLKTLAEKKR